MANNNFITNTSVFTPFSYEELAAPLIRQTEMQNALEDKYGELGAQASAIAALLNPESDKKAFQMYSNYMKELERQAGELSRSGLNNQSRSALMSLFSKYGTDIAPIQKAYENRAEEIKRRQDLMDKDPTRMFSYNPSTVSIDDYMANPSMSFNNYSGALLAQQVSAQVKPIADVLRGISANGRIDNYTKVWLEERGLTAQEIQAAINNPNDPGILQGIVDRVIASSGIDSWGDPTSSMMARYYAQSGLWDALGKDTPHAYEDYGSRAALQHYYATKQQINAANLKAAAAGAQGYGSSQASAWRPFKSTTAGDSKNIKNKGDQQAFKDMYNGNIELDMELLTRIANDNGIDINRIIDSNGNFIQSGYEEMNMAFGRNSMLNTEFELNLTDYSKVANLINRAVNARISKGRNSGLREYVNGRVKDKEEKAKNVLEYINSDMSLVLDPTTGYYIIGRNKDGDIKRFWIDPDTLSGNRLETKDKGIQELQSYLETARQQYVAYVNNNDFESARDAIELLGDNLYWTFNTSRRIQSNTTSEIE